MNILYISKYLSLPEFGSPTRQYFISKFLSKQEGNKVLLIGSRSTLGNVPKIKGLYQSKKEDNLELVTLNGPKINLGFNFKRLGSWIVFEINIFRYRKKIKSFKPDLVIVSSLSILTFISGLFLKKWLKIPLVIEIRDIYPLTLIELGNYQTINPLIILLKWVEKMGYKYADLLVSTLPNAGAHMKSILKRSFQFYWLPMGIDLRFYDMNIEENTDIQNLFEKKPGEFVIGYAGTLGKANALDVIFEAASVLQNTHPHIKFLFIGNGPLKSFFQEKYKNLNNIVFIPAISKTELQQVICKADLLINTWLDKPIYRFGISPNKWIDYMYAAKPILVAFSGYRCIIEEAECGIFVPAQNKQALINGIVQFSEMTTKQLNTMGENGRNYLVNNLSYEKLSAAFYERLRSIKGTQQKKGIFQ